MGGLRYPSYLPVKADERATSVAVPNPRLPRENNLRRFHRFNRRIKRTIVYNIIKFGDKLVGQDVPGPRKHEPLDFALALFLVVTTIPVWFPYYLVFQWPYRLAVFLLFGRDNEYPDDT